ncbi:MAG: hypothetical protein ACXWQO_02285 [Bdellovibrionota bacterium]
MEKPVRINASEKIRGFNEKVRNGLEHALNFMLAAEEGSKINIGAFEPFLMPVEAYISAYKKKSILIKIHAEKDYSGELYWFFELRTAIVLGALMRMMAPGAFAEKLKAEIFDVTDQDAFGEVGNQLCGILDRAFRTLGSKNIHLRMDFDKKVYPDESIHLSSFKNKEEYVVLLCPITMPHHGTQKLTLLLPRSLYETMLNMEIDLDGIQPKLLLLHSQDKALVQKLQMELSSRYVKVLVCDSPDQILDKIETPGVAAVGIDLKEMKVPFAHQDLIFLKRLAANKTLMRMPYYLSWKGADPKSIQEAVKLGLVGANPRPFPEYFSSWAASFMPKTPT